MCAVTNDRAETHQRALDTYCFQYCIKLNTLSLLCIVLSAVDTILLYHLDGIEGDKDTYATKGE